MGKSTAKSSFSQVQSMRARLRKASCMSDESYEDDNLPHGPLHLQPWAPTSRLEAAACPPASQRRSNNGQIDDQLESALFTKLPVELRRMIYTELWRSSNPLMKMHIHGSANGPKLVPTPCQYEPKATFSTRDDEVDPMRTDPWPAWRSRNQPPRWFWHAWGLRLRWGVHWKCQAMAMLNWNPRVDGTCEDLSGTDGRWLGCFLTCRKMYAEAIESLFESTQLIFTASEDAYRFFVQLQHSHMDKIRDLYFAFDHFKDHLFLQRIEAKHPRLPDTMSTVPVAWELWTPLMRCVREEMPELRDLRIHLSAPNVKGEGFVEVLRDWEEEGHGWATENAEGVIYLEMRREKNMITSPRRRDGFM